MNNQNFIQQMIKINNSINTKNNLAKIAYEKYKTDLIKNYFNEVNKECNHENYKHSDYFLKTKMIECTEEEAGFRSIVCQTCGKQILLIKTEDPNWNTKIGNRMINVITNKIKCKKLTKKG